MKTYSVVCNGKVVHSNTCLSEFQAQKNFEALKRKLEYYRDHGSEAGKIKAAKDLATLKIEQDRAPKNKAEALGMLNYVLISRQHLIDDVVKLKAKVEQSNNGWKSLYESMVKAFNDYAIGYKYFSTQAGEFILSDAQMSYLTIRTGQFVPLNDSVDDVVTELLEGGWMGGDLDELGKVLDQMQAGTFKLPPFELGFVDYSNEPSKN